VRSCSDVHNFLDEAGVRHEVVKLPALSTTARKAADLLGVPLGDIVKSLLFVADGGPLVCLVPGDASVDVARLREALACDDVALAAPADVVALTGYRPGAMPPCGLAIDLPVVADPGVFDRAVVYCGGGTTTTMLKIRSADLKATIRPRVAAIAAHPPE